MRIYLQVSKSEIIPFNYQQYLTGAIHKWLGKDNELHGTLALFSFSWIQNAEAVKQGIKTKAGSYFFISAYDENLIKKIVTGIREDNLLFSGMRIKEVQVMNSPLFETDTRFSCASPIFIKRSDDTGKVNHIEYTDNKAGEYLTETLKKKLSKAGLNTEGVNVRFDENYLNPRIKLISYGKVQNRANLCPVIINGSPEQIAFAWDVGVGNCTGIGFGALK